ncbi:MAG TPA: hypothetical protein VGF77_04945 [Allosphingosinicella sp.]
MERAFELARSGRYRHMREIRKQLVREGCDDVDRHLAGTGLRKQLLGEAAEARRRPPANPRVEKCEIGA